MNRPADDMAGIHRLLNYSFAGLDITGYIDKHIRERKEALNVLLSKSDVPENLFAQDKPEAIGVIIRDLYFKKPAEPPDIGSGFVTYSLLAWILQGFSAGSDVDRQYHDLLNRLQQRFEVAHRLFDEYDADMVKRGDSFRTLPNYALLSIVLGLRYLKDSNTNDLNTAVKLNDFLLKSGWPFDTVYTGMIAGAVLLEDKIIAGIYEK